MSSPRVLIVGASIAGPTAAYWLAKAGADVTVTERFPELRTNGQNIDIRTAGVTVMREMTGIEASVRAETLPLKGIASSQSLVSEYEIFRGDLAQKIVDLTKDYKNIKYVFGEQIASLQQNEKDDGPITVEFANGLRTSEYDLVVARDGATSRTRAMGLGCNVRDYIQPTNCWAAYFCIEEDLLKGSQMEHARSAPGGRFMALGPDPSGVNRVTLMGINPRDARDATLPFREAMKQGDDALKRYVAQHYKDAGWKIDEIVKGMMESKDFYANEVVQVKTPSLFKSRFVLVGDAGYAPGFTGAGTTLALADAYVLAGEIGKHKNDFAAGLRAYEEVMRPIISDMQEVPPLVPSVMAPQTIWGIRLRNYIFALIAWTRILEFVQKFFVGAFANIDKYPLPEYKWVA